MELKVKRDIFRNCIHGHVDGHAGGLLCLLLDLAMHTDDDDDGEERLPVLELDAAAGG